MSARGRSFPLRRTPLPFLLAVFLAGPFFLSHPALAGTGAMAPTPTEWEDQDLVFAGTARVAAIEADGSLSTDDGRRLRLAGVALPRRPLRTPADQPWPIETEALAALTELAARQTLDLYHAGHAPDRYGRLPVQAVLADGRWLQGVLLRRGLARVETTPDAWQPLQALLGAEALARRAEAGLWVLPAYRIRRPAEAWRWIDSVQLVEGRVASVRRGKEGLILAFAGDRRHAFSVQLPFAVWTEWVGMPTLRQGMDGAASSTGLETTDPAVLIDQRLRVRGWIGKGRTAQIAVSHAGQIEWIGRPQDRRRSNWEQGSRTRP